MSCLNKNHVMRILDAVETYRVLEMELETNMRKNETCLK